MRTAGAIARRRAADGQRHSGTLSAGDLCTGLSDRHTRRRAAVRRHHAVLAVGDLRGPRMQSRSRQLPTETASVPLVVPATAVLRVDDGPVAPLRSVHRVVRCEVLGAASAAAERGLAVAGPATGAAAMVRASAAPSGSSRGPSSARWRVHKCLPPGL